MAAAESATQEATRAEALRQDVDRALGTFLGAEDAWPQRIHAAMRYSLFAGGKRIRPLLALATAEWAGGEEGVQAALPYACAVEMIHTFSLIHDDLPAMDDDDLRRGRPTAHRAFDEATAILAGDALHTIAFQVIADCGAPAERRVEALRVLSEACGPQGLIGGQMDDLLFEGRSVTAAELDRMHRAKTGALIQASVEGAAALLGVSQGERGALLEFASPLGLAFQIVDDILDVSGSAASLGKTPGKDASARKATYVAVHGLDGARRAADDRLAETLRALERLGPRAGRGHALLDHLARAIVRRSA